MKVEDETWEADEVGNVWAKEPEGQVLILEGGCGAGVGYHRGIARLAACAPEMLRMLRALSNGGVSPHWEQHVRALIRKAGGE